MPRVSAEHLEARRTEILEAAWRCFGRKGFHRTTMRDICAEAELSPGAVYRYFQGKDELIRAVADEGRRLGAGRMVAPDEAGAPLDALGGSLDRFLAVLADPECLPSIRIDVRLCAEALHEPRVRKAVLENLDNLFRLFAARVREAQEEGAVDADLEPRAVGRVLVALFQGLELQKAADPEVDVAACADAVQALVQGTFTSTPSGGDRP